MVQLSWCVYDAMGNFVKEESYYVADADFVSTSSAFKIHNITEEFRIRNGRARGEVLTRFNEDLSKYQPLIVGHFIELDLHVIGAECHRLRLENLAAQLPSFCTMLATKRYVRNPAVEHLRLNELYVALFNRKMLNLHNAQFDARATAECFFELQRRGDIDADKIKEQQQRKKVPKSDKNRFFAIPAVILLLIFIIFSLI